MTTVCFFVLRCVCVVVCDAMFCKVCLFCSCSTVLHVFCRVVVMVFDFSPSPKYFLSHEARASVPVLVKESNESGTKPDKCE